jgi:hypothetical protein
VNIRTEFHLANILHPYWNALGRSAQHDIPDVLSGLPGWA